MRLLNIEAGEKVVLVLREEAVHLTAVCQTFDVELGRFADFSQYDIMAKPKNYSDRINHGDSRCLAQMVV